MPRGSVSVETSALPEVTCKYLLEMAPTPKRSKRGKCHRSVILGQFSELSGADDAARAVYAKYPECHLSVSHRAMLTLSDGSVAFVITRHPYIPPEGRSMDELMQAVESVINNWEN